MKGSTHLSAGILCGIMTVSTMKEIPPSEAFTIVSLSAVGSLLPDLDNSWSYIGRKFTAIAWLIQHLIGHRTALHSAVFWGALSTVAYTIMPMSLKIFVVALSIGIISHLILDAMTVSGIQLFWPLWTRRFRLTHARTGGLLDFCIATICNAISLYAILQYVQAIGLIPPITFF